MEKSGPPSNYTEKVRYTCPFYGFIRYENIMLDQEGNQCALKSPSLSPCFMEINNQIPEWNKCTINPLESGGSWLIDSADNMRVQPNEFKNKTLSLKDWIKYVMRER